MALTEDQRALLELLLAGQSYEDIGSVLGEDPQSVRERASGALSKLRAPSIADDTELTDFVLGQLGPAEEDAVRNRVDSDPGLTDEWRRASAMLKLLSSNSPPSPPSPAPTTPPAPEPPEPPTAEPVEPVPESAVSESADETEPVAEPNPPPPRMPTLNKEQKRLLAALLGIGLVALAIVLAVSGAFGGGSDTNGGTGESASNEAPETSELIRAELRPRGGSGASGAAIFGSAQTEQQDGRAPVLQILAEGLESPGQNRAYVVWLYRSDSFAVPLGAVNVNEQGQMFGQLPVPAQALNLIGDGRLGQIDVTLARLGAYRQSFQAAESAGDFSAHVGQSVLRGNIVGPGLGDGGGGETGDDGNEGP